MENQEEVLAVELPAIEGHLAQEAPFKPVVFQSRHAQLSISAPPGRKVKRVNFNPHPVKLHGEFVAHDLETAAFLQGHPLFLNGVISLKK